MMFKLIKKPNPPQPLPAGREGIKGRVI